MQPGFLFAALPGTAHDGRNFIAAALAAGASAILAPTGTQLPQNSPAQLLTSDTPRAALTLLARAFYDAQPQTQVAVTGTNGKTSIVNFTRQLWSMAGLASASIGTLGVISDAYQQEGSLTTPDPITLHRLLAELAQHGISHCALEASSHGLDQERLLGLQLKAAAFSNLTRDHLDYHQDMPHYFAAKARLFGEVLPQHGIAVLHADLPYASELQKICAQRQQSIWRYGMAGDEIRLKSCTPTPHGLEITGNAFAQNFAITLPLVGAFQADNVLAALGLVVASGGDAAQTLAHLPRLQGVPGRLQQVASVNNAAIYVDYAHTPDALQTVLRALRPHTMGQLHVVFGCGGNRDKGKRPLMGGIAHALADRIIITDDNPRLENPATIRAEILAACPNATEIAERSRAIASAIENLKAGDVLVIAGKGHERGQIIGTETHPFDDAAIAQHFAKGHAA